ncbi:SRPBCC domain-containing protein [Antrihabitans sp. YC2-6]|uniref:SRPBCC domain-containing protein n=1 Tax=Antrihabitans sp. YC2-6 TaxID=2799498 RepID=UPI0018F5DD70|nr:SRPBCC domain-containing protein [Antrihabitans sp. YC2-6]MBJ8345472.1 SRPBCC domain-containing protein [Antrihabitans sp. YC2-6]
MEYGSIYREIYVDASPEIVFDVVSSPEHMREWWPDEADFEPIPGSVGEISWGNRATAEAQIVPITVVEAKPHTLFSFRWIYPEDDAAKAGNSLLVTFELVASGGGTTIRMTETGFREKGWEIAVLEEQYNEHVQGWNTYIPRLGEYVERLVSTK